LIRSSYQSAMFALCSLKDQWNETCECGERLVSANTWNVWFLLVKLNSEKLDTFRLHSISGTVLTGVLELMVHLVCCWLLFTFFWF
jgi:hypothetical protein